MARQKIRLILADIDRTLLPWGLDAVPPRPRAAMHHAMEAGIHVGPATGRGFDWLSPLFSGDVACFRTCVATNGNQVFLDGRKIREASFSGDVLAKVVDVAARFPHAGVIAFDGATPSLANIRRRYPKASDIERVPEAVRKCLKDGATCVDIDVDKIDFSDPKIYELLGSGQTAGVFQVESGGMTATIKNMQPNQYKQIVALIALYRPGPLGAGMVDSYIKRMHGEEKISYYDDRLKPILEETYGTMVYQEQVMQISMKMSGFTPGESDSRMRKPVAKKKIKMLTDQVFHWEKTGADETIYDHWMNGAEANGYSRDRNAGWHLHRRVERVEPVESPARDWNPDDRQDGCRGKYAAEMRRSASSSDNDLEPAPLGRLRILDRHVGRPVR